MEHLVVKEQDDGSQNAELEVLELHKSSQTSWGCCCHHICLFHAFYHPMKNIYLLVLLHEDKQNHGQTLLTDFLLWIKLHFTFTFIVT